MVTVLVTGFGSGTGRIEIIKENFETKVCNNMPVYPLDVYLASGSTWKDGKLSICGGYDNVTHKSECYTMNNGEWQSTKHNLQIARSYHGSSNIGNAIFITGGWNGQILASTDIMHPDGKITPGPDLLQARWDHCQISYEQTTFILGK